MQLGCLFSEPSQTDQDEVLKVKWIKQSEAEDLARSRKDLLDASEKMDISELKAQTGNALEALMLPGHRVHFNRMAVRMENAVQTFQIKKGVIMSINLYRLPRADAMEQKGEKADYYVTDTDEEEEEDDDHEAAGEVDGSVAQTGTEHDDSKTNHHETAKRARDDSNSCDEADQEPSAKKAK